MRRALLEPVITVEPHPSLRPRDDGASAMPYLNAALDESTEDRGLHMRVREFYHELVRLAEERLDDARNLDEERLL
jgi:hypothetical protein